MTVSFAVLIVGWAFAMAGIYFLTGVLLGFDTGQENASLAAIWAFLFSFGAVSVSGLIAAIVGFAELKFVRKVYIYSIWGSAALFFGYTIIGTLAGLFGW